jgi:hypothetical protein
MKQTINLLPLKPKIKRNWLAFNNMLIALLSLTIILVGSAGWLWWQTKQAQHLNTQQLQKNMHIQTQLAALTSQLESREIPYKLNNQRFELQQQVQAMQQMANMTSQEKLPRTTGFLETVNSIRISMPAAAQLEHFKLGAKQNLVSLKGSVAKVEDVPKLIEMLRSNELLHNQKISNINVQHSGDRHTFELLSERGGN